MHGLRADIISFSASVNSNVGDVDLGSAVTCCGWLEALGVLAEAAQQLQVNVPEPMGPKVLSR